VAVEIARKPELGFFIMKGCPQKVNGNTGYVTCGTSSITTHHSTIAALPPPPTMQVECFFFSFDVASKSHHNTNTTKGHDFFCPSHTHTHTHSSAYNQKTQPPHTGTYAAG